MIALPLDALEPFIAEIFVQAGCSAPEGQRVAHSLLGANLTGHDSHGIIRVPRYCAWLHEGALVAGQTVSHIVDAPGFAVLDGHYGFGQTVAPQAVEIGIVKAKASGLAAVALRSAGHIGRVGEWAEQAAQAGLVSVHFVNAAGSILVAPFGGVERRFSTAPFCVGIPRAGAEPVILDFATSLVAEGKVMVASQGGKNLPPDALVGPSGETSSDPALLYGPLIADGPRDSTKGQGAIRAFGDHKGSGLALICELLGGALTGNGATSSGRTFANGMFSIYIDPARLDPAAFFDGEIARYLDYVKATKPAAGIAEVLLPGEPERRMRAQRQAEGVPLSQETWDAICETARRLGVPETKRPRPNAS